MKGQTEEEYLAIIKDCKDLFKKKTQDYGTAWRILRLPSITDQIFIKAQRIRSIQEKGRQKVDDDIASEYQGIINYCIIAMMQIELKDDPRTEMEFSDLEPVYDKWSNATHALLADKNHDYGEAWRDMRLSSITDIILMKILRVKQIEDNEGKTLVSEGIIANYQDMINYSVFSLIKIKDEN